ncbi:thrombospondin type-1 domain-containing protein 1 [Galendromus occidentalis]|uniref:Thrombospondin type-1 domain-containing protein 1 n=1 Tax=Galendromus occidentalis TaxID=34638 RepID=A0AAJ6QQ18_9ACAR|nr:thrombospondin type-1 domain-containing protein 1 [Galendromus occidentalis]
MDIGFKVLLLCGAVSCSFRTAPPDINPSALADDDSLDFYITGPERYVALSTDMTVFFTVPHNNTDALLARVVDKSGKTSTTSIPPSTPSGSVIIPCGMIHRAGNYTLELISRSNETVLARSRYDTVVEWPSVVVHVPLLIETHSSDAAVTFELPDKKCPPFHRETYTFQVDLLYLGDGGNSSWLHEIYLESKRVFSWREIEEQEVTFSCENFDRPGFYQVSLRCEDCEQGLAAIAKSQPIQAAWSGKYRINVAQQFIGTCFHGINIAYHFPPCTGNQDRLRVYGINEENPEGKYLLEKRLSRDRHAIVLSCHHFDGPYDKFCFHYVTFAKNRAVNSVDVHCRAVRDDSSEFGMWDEWSSWTFCTGNCGRGTQMRHRDCSRKKCKGEQVESRECDLPEKCPSTTAMPPDINLNQVATYCSCGCVLGVFKNTTVYFRASECAQSGSHTSWLLRPVFHNASSIIVRLTSARLADRDSFYIVVRDGIEPDGTMLAMITGGEERKLPLELRSISGPIRVDFIQRTAEVSPDVDFLMSFYEELQPRKISALAQIGLLYKISRLPYLHLVALLVVGSVLIVTATLCLVHRVALGRAISKQRRPSVFSIPPTSAEGQGPTDLLLSRDSLETVLSPSPSPSPTPTVISVPSRATTTPITANADAIYSSTGSPLRTNKKTSVLASLESLADVNNLVRKKLRKKNPSKLQRHSVMCTSSEFGSTSGTDGFEFDAYDYGCEDIPNSFFNSTTVVLPPFLSEKDLRMFRLPPSTVENIEVQDLTDSAETLAPLDEEESAAT